MKIRNFLFVSVLCLSFCPSIEKTESSPSNGYYIFVEDFTERTNHKYIVETKDSVDNIFDFYLNSELELGKVDRPITIYNGKRNFYVARVNVYRKPNGKMGFKHLKYPDVYNKRSKLKPVRL